MLLPEERESRSSKTVELAVGADPPVAAAWLTLGASVADDDRIGRLVGGLSMLLPTVPIVAVRPATLACPCPRPCWPNARCWGMGDTEAARLASFHDEGIGAVRLRGIASSPGMSSKPSVTRLRPAAVLPCGGRSVGRSLDGTGGGFLSMNRPLYLSKMKRSSSLWRKQRASALASSLSLFHALQPHLFLSPSSMFAGGRLRRTSGLYLVLFFTLPPTLILSTCSLVHVSRVSDLILEMCVPIFR